MGFRGVTGNLNYWGWRAEFFRDIALILRTFSFSFSSVLLPRRLLWPLLFWDQAPLPLRLSMLCESVVSTSRRETAPSASMSSVYVRRRCSPHRPPLVLPQARMSRRGGVARVIGRRRRSKRKQEEKRKAYFTFLLSSLPPWPPRHEVCFLLPSILFATPFLPPASP